MRIEPYVLTYLAHLSNIGFEILFISNSTVLPEARKELEESVNNFTIFERENKGNDFGGWKWAIENKIIPPDTDYLLLTNDSIYGPFFPLEPLFESMMAKPEIDFWGLTDCYQNSWHIQSYFVVLSKKVFTSKAFKKIFKVDFARLDKKNIILKGEINLTKALLEAGFNAAVSMPYKQLDPDFEVWDAKNPTHTFWDRLITELNFPFIKKELVLQNPESLQNVAKLFTLLQEQSDYPVENIRISIANYLAAFDKPYDIPHSISVICHLYYPGTIYYFLTRLFPLRSANTQFVFNLSGSLTQNEFFLDMLRKYFPNSLVLSAPNQGRDIGGKLAGFDIAMKCNMHSEYTLIIHDKLSSHSSTGVEWRNKLLRIVEPTILPLIFKEFETNKKTGVITTKDLIQNEFDYDTDQFTCTSNSNILNYINKYNLNVKDYNFAAGTIFWIRTEILYDFFRRYPALTVRKGFERGNALDFGSGTNIHAWERLFSFIAHSRGFKTTGI